MRMRNYEPCVSEKNILNLNCKITKSRCKDFSVIKQEKYCMSEDTEEDLAVETTGLRHSSETSRGQVDDSPKSNNYLTVPGIIKKGKKEEQCVQVILNLSREELEIFEASLTKKRCCLCNENYNIGFHIFLWTLFCFPFSVFMSGIYSFCMGTITWYNVFKLFSEKEALGYRILVPPLLVLLYPFLIISISLGLGVYAGLKQLSCCWNSWHKEFVDYEKGFYSWLCNSLDVPECSPYEVVILSSVQQP